MSDDSAPDIPGRGDRPARTRVAHALPAPSLLAVAGLGIGLLPGMPTWDLAPQVILIGLLPPLLFASAQDLHLPDVRALAGPLLALAVGLVAVSAIAVAVTTRATAGGLTFAAALTLGAVLASTDPVAVSALSRRLRLPQRVRTLVQAESLFNDATSLVLFQVAVGTIASRDQSAGDVALLTLRLAGGGIALGLLAGGRRGAARSLPLRRRHGSGRGRDAVCRRRRRGGRRHQRSDGGHRRRSRRRGPPVTDGGDGRPPG